MQTYDVIEKGITNKDKKLLREAIGNMCYINKDFSNDEFFKVIKHVEDSNVELKEELKGNLISNQKSEFEDEDFTRAVFELKNNFCDDRIKDVMIIGKTLYGKKVNTSTQKPDTSKQVETQGKNPNQSSHRKNNEVMVIGGLVAVAIIVIVIAILLRGK